MKLVAILSGGDWCDASVTHLKVLESINLQDEKEKYIVWYNTKCFRDDIKYLTFTEYLLKNKLALEVTNEIEEFWDE